MSWSHRTRAGAGLAALAAAALWLAAPLVAQEPLEKRYERAVEFFNNAKMEDACELLQQIEKEKPGFQQTRTYLGASCKEAERIRNMEKQLFDDGVQLFNQGKYDDAQQKLKQAQSIPLKNPKYREQIAKYLADIDARLGEDKLFTEAVQFFNQSNDTEARPRFNQIVRGGGAKAAEARTYLQRIEERREESAFNEGMRLMQGGDYSAARSRFQEVVGLNGKRKAEAERYLGQLEQGEREQRAFNDGVRAFEAKRYADAQASFRQVVAMNGSRKAEAERNLARIDMAIQEEAAFKEGVQKFARNDFDGARADFQKVISLKGSLANDARVYLTRIDARGQDPREVAQQFVADAQAAMNRKDYRAAVEKLSAATALDPNNRDARRLLTESQQLAEEAPLRRGLQAYFEGKYDEAERQLSDYLAGSGKKQALAYFFRGAARSARYFLSGEKDAQQKQRAQEDFRATQKDNRRFRPPEKYVSPKILALYTEVAPAETR
jgi:tetratricopeptide (TPR) repeat protein